MCVLLVLQQHFFPLGILIASNCKQSAKFFSGYTVFIATLNWSQMMMVLHMDCIRNTFFKEEGFKVQMSISCRCRYLQRNITHLYMLCLYISALAFSSAYDQDHHMICLLTEVRHPTALTRSKKKAIPT